MWLLLSGEDAVVEAEQATNDNGDVTSRVGWDAHGIRLRRNGTGKRRPVSNSAHTAKVRTPASHGIRWMCEVQHTRLTLQSLGIEGGPHAGARGRFTGTVSVRRRRTACLLFLDRLSCRIHRDLNGCSSSRSDYAYCGNCHSTHRRITTCRLRLINLDHAPAAFIFGVWGTNASCSPE